MDNYLVRCLVTIYMITGGTAPGYLLYYLSRLIKYLF